MNLFEFNEEAVIAMLEEAIKQKVEELAQEKIFWTVSELEHYTNMHINTMKKHFFTMNNSLNLK